MAAADKRKLLQRTLEGLQGRTLVVEGKHDVRALAEAGISARVITATGRPERVVGRAGKEAVLLFDFDEEGRRKARVFSELFQAAGAEADLLPRRRLGRLLGLRTFEELPAKLREFEEKNQVI